MNNQHANTEAARRLAAAQIGGEDQVFDIDADLRSQINEMLTAELVDRLRNDPDIQAEEDRILNGDPDALSRLNRNGPALQAGSPSTAQDARQRIRAAAIGDVVPLDTFPARAKSIVNTLVQNIPAHVSTRKQTPPTFQERTFERTPDGWKRVA